MSLLITESEAIMDEKQYWSSLEELESEAGAAGAPGASDVRILLDSIPTVDRRAFLKLMGLSLAAGALSGCRRPVEKIVPYLTQPPEVTPSVASWYATTCHGCSAGCGALAKVIDGRPIKFEGNPDHGRSRGGLCAAGQGAVLSLYDSYRQKEPAKAGKAVSWAQIDQEIGQALAAARKSGRKVVLLTATLTGPAARALASEFLASFPRAEHVVYDAVSCDAIREAHARAYGQRLIPGYRFDRAEVIVSFGADFLGTWLSPVEFTKQYSAGRNLVDRTSPMSRHFQFESRLSLTGSNADVRCPIPPSEQSDYLLALATQITRRLRAGTPPPAPPLRGEGGLTPASRSMAPSTATGTPLLPGEGGSASPSGSKAPVTATGTPLLVGEGPGEGSPSALAAALASLPSPTLPQEAEERLSRVAEALLKARGRSLVVSDSDDVVVQLLVLALNELLGNVDQTVDLNRPLQQKQGRDADMARLLGEMERGEVAVLLVHGCNPVYTYPKADKFAAALKGVPCSVSFAVTPDETARATTYHCPSHHPMEAWGDAEPEAGRLSLFQPTIRPLYQTRAFEDSLLQWSGRQQTFYDYLRHHWQTKIHPRCQEAPEFVAFWDQMLQRGYLELPTPSAKRAPLAADTVLAAVHQRAKQDRSAGAVEIELFEPVALRDGTAANNAWLQELPDPVTKITWDNFAAISPALAREKGIEEGQWIEITAGDRKLQAPAHIQPGQHARTVSLALGYGRTHAGPVGNSVGVSAYPLIGAADGRFRYTAVECAVAPATAAGRQRREFARTQIHASMEDRPIVLETTHGEFQKEYTAEHGHHASSHADLWEEHDYPEYKWGMAIDLTKCIGCSGCVTACDIENNIPVVGPEEVGQQREMHWLRIDRYFTGDAENPEVVHQPMLCQQCDNASCETVCPVLATVHDDQGLNVQVYNRCVGTRYCSNNCAYKARRFNFFNNISNGLTQNLALNPDVTVRSRGVMEKCTFCIQRIQEARIIARREGRTIRDGEVRPACEQSCPADAIVFGNLKDPNSRVSRLAASPRRYRVLEELNRKPAIYYLALVRNNEEAEV